MRCVSNRKNMKEIIANQNLIAYCGLYCGACPSYLKGKCPGCRENEKATWCKNRQCCIENNYLSCADCTTIEPMKCKKYNTFISKIICFLLRSDRNACLNRIKEIGYEAFATEMAEKRIVSIKK